ncbi:MAG: triose-phosphate isomerase [Firmicutes bacterium]|nr:triose-phosphate isomerase [Bacillota bacterium]
MRTPIIAGNWKMHKTVGEAVETCRKLEEVVTDSPVEVVVCAPFTSLSALSALGMEKVQLGAQNMFYADQGAYTGEISGQMLVDTGCSYVILGHSERREIFGEDDELINKKVLKALELGLRPILCVGETLSQRKAGETEEVVVSQTAKALSGVAAEQLPQVVIAYEPIWAIGTGENSTPEDANRVIGLIRSKLAELYDGELAGQVRIQYGGSVKPENIAGFMQQPEIDGALVGGASLAVEDFAAIIDYQR